MGKKSVKGWRRLHKWPGILLALIVILYVLSGIILNHRGWVSSIEVDRNWLPESYQYQDWNLAALRSSVVENDNSILVYGNIGVWQTDSTYSTFRSYNDGFGKGIDRRKVETMLVDHSGKKWAGTLFGLYSREPNQEEWQPVDLNIDERRIVDLLEHRGSVVALTRSHVLVEQANGKFRAIELSRADGQKNRASLFKTLWMLHSGELFGNVGKIVVDLLGIVLLILSITGLLHFIFPKLIRYKRKKGGNTKKAAQSFRTNLKWHNLLGWICFPFLVVMVITGMFLRPPLLIPIAHTKVDKIPFTHIDQPNPWYDLLRRIAWDDQSQRFLLSTSEGFYWVDENFEESPVSCAVQPPVSVMGCNVLYNQQPNTFIIGSFNGLYAWQTELGQIYDVGKQQMWQPTPRSGPPISEHMISGMMKGADKKMIVFDYNRGATFLNGEKALPAMPKEVVEQSPMSLWNLALEVHTGRIFEPILGMLYLLYIPLTGLTIALILLSGFMIWWRRYRKR